MLFKLLVGSHAVANADKSLTHFVKGEEIESDLDFVEMFGSDKFARVYVEGEEEDPKPKRKRKRLQKTPTKGMSDGD